jgi:hypothetical protein
LQPESTCRYYILVGEAEAWKIGLLQNIWGFSEKTRGLWNTSKERDYLAFYVTSPIKKVIGFGRIKRKFTDDSLVWSDEKLFQRPIWKYRFEFEQFHALTDWSNGVVVPSDIMLNVGRKVVSQKLFCALVRASSSKWKTNLVKHIPECR